MHLAKIWKFVKINPSNQQEQTGIQILDLNFVVLYLQDTFYL